MRTTKSNAKSKGTKKTARPARTTILKRELQALRDKIEELTEANLNLYNALHPPVMGSTPPEPILLEAHRLVYGVKQEEYGSVTENFGNIAKQWSVTLGKNITPEQVGLCMVQVKIARQMHKHNWENLIDGAGYFGTIAKMKEE